MIKVTPLASPLTPNLAPRLEGVPAPLTFCRLSQSHGECEEEAQMAKLDEKGLCSGSLEMD